MDLVKNDVTYSTDDPAEITRLRSRGFAEASAAPVPQIEDVEFHPGDHNVDEVLTHLAEHPEDHARVVAEEKAGKARQKIVGA